MAESGYAVVIEAFVPFDLEDLNTLPERAEAVKKAQAGDFAPLLAVARIESFRFKAFTSRRSKGEAPAAGEPDPGEGASS